MASFLQILEEPTAGKAGHIAASSNGFIGTTLARVVEANINAGLGVVSGATKGKTVKAPASAAEVRNLFEGVLIDPEFKNDVNAAADYLAGQQASVHESGYIWVQVEGSPAVGGDVYLRHTSDGGSNTTLGKFRTDNDFAAGLVITPSASPVQTTTGGYLVRLKDAAGNDETFIYSADSSATVAEIAAGLVALIDASPNFAATGTVTVTVTAAAGGVIEVLQLGEHLTVTAGNRAEKVPGAKFMSTASGGIAKIRLPAK